MVPEIPRLEPRRAALVVGLFLVAIFGTALFDGASYALVPGHEWELEKGAVRRRRSGVGVRGGAPMRMVEARVEEVSRTGSYLRPFWAESLYRGLRHTGVKVTAGRDGWLFLTRTLSSLRRRFATS